MSVQVQQLTRVFRFGATELPDLDPALTPEQVLTHYHGAYPFLAMARVGVPTVEGDRTVYPIIKPEAQTKGAGLGRLTKAQRDALDAAEAIGSAESESRQCNAERWEPVAQFTRSMLNRRPTPVADAMMVPML